MILSALKGLNKANLDCPFNSLTFPAHATENVKKEEYLQFAEMAI